MEHVKLESLVESCRPQKRRGRPSYKRQLVEIRQEKKINLQTAESVIIATNLKSILTSDALKSLPPQYQTQLRSLLPEVDQDGNSAALNNEFFARFCTQYQEKLSHNKFSDEALDQAKNTWQGLVNNCKHTKG